MPLFSYTGTDSDGQSVSGTLEADTQDAAHNTLKDVGIDVVSLEVQGAFPLEREGTEVREELEEKEVQKVQHREETDYYPLIDTIRLYAGWLLAWFGAVFALGFYQSTRPLSFRIPYVENLSQSPVLFQAALGLFLLLLFSGFYKATGRNIVAGLMLLCIGLAGFAYVLLNL